MWDGLVAKLSRHMGTRELRCVVLRPAVDCAHAARRAMGGRPRPQVSCSRSFIILPALWCAWSCCFTPP